MTSKHLSPITYLLNRASSGRLSAPAPDGETLKKILQTGLTAPDHGRLKPWHYILVQGDNRADFVEEMLSSLKRGQPDLSDEKIQKRRRYYNSIPLFIVLGIKLQEHPKIPKEEQKLSVAASAMNILNALEMSGYAGMWISGTFCKDPLFIARLRQPHITALAGIIFAGSADINRKRPQRPDIDEHIDFWEKPTL